MTLTATFLRYENADSTVELICTNCLQVVGRELRPSEVVKAQETHVCDPWEFDDHYVDSQRGTF
jgi:hypothetical protein